MAFSSRFGQLDEVPIVGVGQKERDNKYISVVSNVKENGISIGGLGDQMERMLSAGGDLL